MILTDPSKEYIEACKDCYESCLRKSQEQKTDLLQILVISLAYGLIKPEYGKWLNQCLNHQNWQELNNLIFQFNHHHFIPGCPIGCDHSSHFIGCLNALACGDWNVIEQALPYELELSQNGYPFYVISTNLLMALWYNDDFFMEKTLPIAKKFTLSKKSQWERAVISYLIALHDRDITTARIQLQKICELYMRLGKNKYIKQLCIEAHGLYFLAQCLFSMEQFQQMHMPDCKNFSTDYALWRLQHLKPDLNLYFEYPFPMEILNKIYMAPIAKSILHQPYTKQINPYLTRFEKLEWVLDTDCMVHNFVAEIDKLITADSGN